MTTENIPMKNQLILSKLKNTKNSINMNTLSDNILKPSFFVVGAQKAGTTSLYEILKSHSEIFLPKKKEIRFFDFHYSKGLKWYLEKNFNNLTESTTRSCAWEVDLNKDEASKFAIKLDNAAENCTAKLDADWLTSNTTIKCVRNKLKIKAENAICTSGHQISYFQKDCNKKLSFIIEKSKGKKIAQYLTSYLNSGNDLVVEK